MKYYGDGGQYRCSRYSASRRVVTMVMVLDTQGLPAEDVSLIMAVDWFL